MMGASQPFHTRTHRTTSERETVSFINSSSQSGFTVASKVTSSTSISTEFSGNIALVAGKGKLAAGTTGSTEANRSYANDKRHKEELKAKVTEAFVSEFTYMPMKTFRLREGGLVLGDYAFYRLRKWNLDWSFW